MKRRLGERDYKTFTLAYERSLKYKPWYDDESCIATDENSAEYIATLQWVATPTTTIEQGKRERLQKGDKNQKNLKYLGTAVGEELSFLPYIRILRDKLSAVAGKIRRITRSVWGLSRRAVPIVYSGLLIIIAAYGSSIWCDTAHRAFGLRLLFSVQRIKILACIPVCPLRPCWH